MIVGHRPGWQGSQRAHGLSEVDVASAHAIFPYQLISAFVYALSTGDYSLVDIRLVSIIEPTGVHCRAGHIFTAGTPLWVRLFLGEGGCG